MKSRFVIILCFLFSSILHANELHDAVRSCNLKRVIELTYLDINLDEPDPDGRTALHVAAASQRTEQDLQTIIQLLVGAKADLDARDRNGNAPLHLAAQEGLPTTIQTLIDLRATIDAVNLRGETPLYLATSTFIWERADMLLKNGADPKITVHGQTVYQFAQGQDMPLKMRFAFEEYAPTLGDLLASVCTIL